MKIEAYAKVNFTLEVLGERADGFHALRSLVVPVTLSDTIDFSPAPAFSTNTGYPDDLCLRAASALRDMVGRVALNAPSDNGQLVGRVALNAPLDSGQLVGRVAPNAPSDNGQTVGRVARMLAHPTGFASRNLPSDSLLSSAAHLNAPSGNTQMVGRVALNAPSIEESKNRRIEKFPPALPAFSLSLAKRIPAGGGLGGGSADAAATLIALNRLWGLGLTDAQLAEIGAEVGSDVPALVYAQSGVPVVMEGRGEIARPAPEAARRLNLVLVNPGVFSSTAEVFAKCGARKPRVTTDGGMLYNMLHAIGTGDLDAIASALSNDLEESAVALHPEIGEAKRALGAAGAVGVSMSGSGSTVFGLVRTEAEGREIAASMRVKGWSAWSATTHCPVV